MNDPAVFAIPAAALDWLEGLLPLVFVVIWIVSQVMNLFRAPKQPEIRLPAPPAGRPRGGGRGVPPNLQREIEDFLHRSPAPAAPPPAVEAKPARRRPRRPAPAATVEAGRPPAAVGDVASHVATAFANDLAHESPSTTAVTPAVAVPLPTAELIAALREPGSLARLVIVQELLTRPTHRW